MKTDKPPVTSRGAEDTGKNQILLDWCGFTVDSLEQVFQVLELPPEEFTELETGALGYTKQKVCNGIRVMYDGAANMGAHVEMSGKACRYYEGKKGDKWWRLVTEVFQRGGKFSRIDLAIDTYNGEVNLKTVERKIKQGHVKTGFQKSRVLTEYNLKDGGMAGKTIYFGSPSSMIQIRMYDKTLERKKTEEEVPDNWVRVEIQSRDKRALSVAQHILFNKEETIGKLCKQILRYYVNFLVASDNDTNKARWKICQWWIDFTDGLEGIPLTIKEKARSIETIRTWLGKQVSKSLAMMAINEKGHIVDTIPVMEIVLAGLQKIREKELNLVREHIQTKKEEAKKLASLGS